MAWCSAASSPARPPCRGFLRLRLELAAASSSSCWPCLIWRRRFRRNLEVLRGSSELDELELELVLLEGTLSNFWTLILSFLRRSFLLPHFVFALLVCFGHGCVHL